LFFIPAAGSFLQKFHNSPTVRRPVWINIGNEVKPMISRLAIAACVLFSAAAFAAAPANLYLQHNLVANTAGTADVTDPNLVDPWSIAFSATGPFWIANHLSGTATVYNGAGAITPLVVTISPAPNSAAGTLGRPTGQVQNPTTGFTLANGKPASFIFSTDDGLITAWNTGTTDQIMVNNSGSSAVYKGLAINPSATAPMLYAANFRSGKIDVFNGSFQPTTVPGGFVDPNQPAGYAPFNIWPLGGKLYVTYAQQDSNKFLDVAGPGNGVVNVFDFNGNLLNRLISNGVLNSPWGVAIAPAGWGAFGGDLLVGNFGDGRINAFDSTGKSLGPLQDANGNPITISGLWALVFGNGGRGGDINTLYFVAGVPDGSSVKRGILGSIAPPAQIDAIYNAAGGQQTAIAPGEIVILTGQTVGPSPLVSTTLPATGAIGSTVGGTSVTFNNLPAPVLYASGAYTSVIVPYGVAGSTTASVVLTTGSQTTPAFSIPVAASVPGVFTTNGGGTGQALALNQDGSLNFASNADARGSVVILFATGEGVTDPPGTDGAIDVGLVFHEPVLPVSVSIGGTTAQFLYAIETPGDVAGVLEVGAVIPSGITPGTAVPAVLTVGTASSQTVTLNVK
jgi:uncharacterized protein (TIGR03118 family)